MLPSLEDLVAIRVSGPSRASAVEVVNSFMFEASERGRPAALRADDLAGFGVDHEQAAGAAAALVQPGAHLVAGFARRALPAAARSAPRRRPQAGARAFHRG